jgi:autotransporter strand-loop-strand O-heptosyltransferase
MFDLVLGHTSFLGHTGYANHAREFYSSLSEQIPVRVRNFCHVRDVDYLEQSQKDMLVKQFWSEPPYEIGTEFDRDKYESIVNVLLLETNHFWYYQDYQGPKVAYNVWESTRQPQQFFDKLVQFDQMWVPSWWQRKHTIEQGYPADRVFVVPEGVDGEIFKPGDYQRGNRPFRFMLFGRWDYRKGILESIRAFVEEFKHDDGVELLISVDNPFPTDGLASTEERLERYGLQSEKIKVVHFPPNEEYVRLLQTGDVFVSCARSEGWNLPLMEAMACGTVAICSNCSAQLDFARGIAHLVDISHMSPPKEVFMQDKNVPGFWYEPDFEHLKRVMRDCYVNHARYKERALWGSEKLRERYTWEKSASAAMEALGALDKQLKPHQPIRLNVGCGDRRFDGYLSVDKYYPGVDIQRDANDLGFDDNSVDEIKSFHMLEHLNKFEVGAVLREWYRVLRPGGELWLNIPDLEWCLVEWIRTPEKDKLGHSLDRVFGLQNKPGEEHKCGYTKNNARLLLEDYGFVVDKCTPEWMSMYNQQCLDIRAHKPKDIPKEVILIGGYINTPQQEQLLLDRYFSAKATGLDVCFVGHYPLKPEIAKLFDYVIYERENLLSPGWDLTWWYDSPGNVKIGGKFGQGTYQSVAILNAWNSAFKTLQNKYDAVYYVEVDVVVDVAGLVEELRKHLLVGKRFVGFGYNNNKPGSGVCTAIFATNTQWALDKLPRYGSFDEYLIQANQMHSDGIFEIWLRSYLKHIGQEHTCEFLSYDTYWKLVEKENVIVRECKDDIKVTLGETIDGKVIVFVVGFSGKWSDEINCCVKFNGVVLLTDVFKRNDVRWVVFDKVAGMLEVSYNGYTDVFNISPGRDYTDTTFEFYDPGVSLIPLNNSVPVFYVPTREAPINLNEIEVPTFSFIYREIYKHNAYGYGKCKLAKGDVVIDCGANIGVFSRYAKVCGASEVYSFEPEPGNYAALEKNVTTKVYNEAVSDKESTMELYIHSCEGGHSLKDDNINHTQLGYTVPVRTTTLDKVIANNGLDRVNFLKIDVEGSELDIFNGLSDENLLKVDKIAMEYHNMILKFDTSLRDGLVKRLRDSGFRVHVMFLDPGKHLQMIYAWRSAEEEEHSVRFNFIEGATCEILGESDGRFKVDFIDKSTNRVDYSTVIETNHWAKPYKRYYVEWLIKVWDELSGELVAQHELDLTDKRVLIGLGSSSLGDSLAWVPYIEEFRKLHRCRVIAATWVNDLVRSAYPEIEFVEPGSTVSDIYARYEIGCYDNDESKNKTNWRLLPIQQIASDMLGLEYREVRPKLGVSIGDRPIKEKYFCLAEHSTLQCKYWNRQNGWQNVVNWLASLGYKVVVVSKEPTGLRNVVDRTNRHIFDTINTLKHSEGFFGVSSGLAWVSWALEVPVVMVSGFTQEWNEFTTGIARVINKEVCHGCINHTKYPFERGNWNWCPRGKNFECSREISADMVIQKAKEFFGL